MKEIWKEIIGYNGDYYGSNLGRVKSYKYSSARNFKILKNKKSTKKDENNYYVCVTLCNRLGGRRNVGIHVIVAKLFIPNPQNKPCVNHKNGIRNDNRIENLEWCTHKENSRHAYDTQLNYGKKGIDNPKAKICDNDVRKIREFRKNKTHTLKELSTMFGLSESYIYEILSYKTWKHI